MTRSRLIAALALAAALALPCEGRGQFTVGVHTGVGVLAGDDFDGNEGGTTINLEAMVGATAGWQFGGGIQYTSLGLEERSESVGQLDVLGAARYMFQPDLAQLYIGARGGFSRQSTELDGVSITGQGFSIGPSIGVILPFPWFGFEIAMDARYLSYGDFERDGDTTPGSASTGVHLGGRVGLSFKLGN